MLCFKIKLNISSAKAFYKAIMQRAFGMPAWKFLLFDTYINQSDIQILLGFVQYVKHVK